MHPDVAQEVRRVGKVVAAQVTARVLQETQMTGCCKICSRGDEKVVKKLSVHTSEVLQSARVTTPSS